MMNNDLEEAENTIDEIARDMCTDEPVVQTYEAAALIEELRRLRRLVASPRVVAAGFADPVAAARFGPAHRELMEAVGDLTCALPGAIACVPGDREGFWAAHAQSFAAWAAADRVASLARNLGDQLMQRTQDLLKGRCIAVEKRAGELAREEVPMA